MTKNEFIKEISEYCEFENGHFTPETALHSIDGYDSLAVLSMIAFIDEHLSARLTAAQFSELTDFRSLIETIGEEKFEDG